MNVDYRNDPYFAAFAEGMARIVNAARAAESNPPASEPVLEPGLITRAFARYTKPGEHPLVILAKQAQACKCEITFREKVAAMLKAEAKSAAQQAGVKLAIAVYDAALQPDAIALREAVAQAGQCCRAEWTEAV